MGVEVVPAPMARATATVKYERVYPATTNSPAEAEFAADVAEREVYLVYPVVHAAGGPASRPGVGESFRAIGAAL